MSYSPLPGIKVLGFGDIGTGKTTMIKSLISAGLTPMCIFTEPGQEMVADVPADKLHWMYIRPLNPDLKTLMDSSKRVGQMNPDQLQKANDMNRDKENQFYPILSALAKFKCQRTGQDFGNVSTWGTDKCLVMDSLSGITIAAEKNAVGEKYAKTQPEFQIAMKLIENFVNQLAVGFYCHVYLTAHPEREMDEVNQAIRIYPSTLGRKLAPLLGRNFSDVIYTEMWMDGANPRWGMSTVHAQAAVKTRNWPHAARQPLSFVPAVETWKKRGGIISAELPPPELR
jgi:hypothetical protein